MINGRNQLAVCNLQWAVSCLVFYVIKKPAPSEPACILVDERRSIIQNYVLVASMTAHCKLPTAY